jgi:hypothetical protein
VINSLTVPLYFFRDFTGIRVIEINDPPPTAGTSLFDWDSEEDRNIIWGNINEDVVLPVVRIRDQPYPWPEQDDLHPPLKRLIDEQRGRVPKEKEREKEKCTVM